MTYHAQGNGKATILVGRKGYSDLGYSGSELSLPWCGNLPANSTQICRSENTPSGSGFGSNRGPGPSTLDKVGSFFGSFGGALIGTIGGQQQQQQPVIMPSSGPSPVVLMAAIGGIGLLALLIMRKPRAANPGRRRRNPRRARRRSRR
jgi:hypothetical protein